MKRVLFIQPPFERLMGYTRFYTHQGLLSLAAVVKEAGNEVMVYDADYNPDGQEYSPLELLEHYNCYVDEMNNFSSNIWKEITHVIEEYRPTHIGITVLTPTLDVCRKIAKIIRNISSNIIIISGGAHATVSPNDLLEWSDFVIQYEGELVINDIINGKISKRIVRGPRVQDLDSLPFPAISSLYKLERFKKRDLSLVISTRGCPFECKFCSSPILWKRRTTRKSVSYFIQELLAMKNDYGIHDFYISDDSFSINEIWLKEFCHEVKKINITWRCLERVNSITNEKVRMMKAAGCRNIKIGVESGSQRILDRINKNITIKEIKNASNILKENGMEWSAFFMIGIPGETEDDIKKTQQLIKEISANSVTVSIFTPYPGNQLIQIEKLDYKLYSHHSPNNNFTNEIPNDRFKQLVKDTLKLCNNNYKEHECKFES